MEVFFGLMFAYIGAGAGCCSPAELSHTGVSGREGAGCCSPAEFSHWCELKSRRRFSAHRPSFLTLV